MLFDFFVEWIEEYGYSQEQVMNKNIFFFIRYN